MDDSGTVYIHNTCLDNAKNLTKNGKAFQPDGRKKKEVKFFRPPLGVPTRTQLIATVSEKGYWPSRC